MESEMCAEFHPKKQDKKQVSSMQWDPRMKPRLALASQLRKALHELVIVCICHFIFTTSLSPCLLFSFKSTSESSNEKSYKYGPPQRFPPILYIRAHSFKKVKLAPPCFLLGSNLFRVVCPSVNVFDVRHLKCVETPALTPTPKYLMVCIVYSLFPFFPSLHHCFFMSLLSLYHPFLVNKYGKCDGQQTI